MKNRTLRKIFKIGGLAFLFLFLSSCDSGSGFKHLRKEFAFPSSEYKTVPFWVWNGVVTEEMIDEQLEDFSEHGIGGVFVHPRYGLITEYASKEWYELVHYAMKKARSLDMKLWLYDENSYPSGFAGGLVPAGMPSSFNEGIALKLHRQSRLHPDSTKEYLHIFKGHIDFTDKVDSLTGKKGDFLLYEKILYPKSDWFAGYSYVDLIKPGVTEKFIELTMTGYEEKLGSEFGSTVPGIFTDEPNIAPSGGHGLIRWTPDLYENFEQRWGYKLEPHLVSIVENVGDYKTVRHNYYQLLLELFIECWSKPWYEYTEKNNLAWTGHYWEHGWPSPHHGPDNMAMYAWHQVPGIDMLFNNWDEHTDQFGNIRAVRELNSVGNQLGRKRKLSETYGGSGWELTFEEMKRNGDWEYALGVNMMNQHLSFQTLMGERKHDYPQSFSTHSPWWDEYNSLADYYARLSLALSSGKQINRVLVLEPTTSAWMHYATVNQNSDIGKINKDFTSLLIKLEEEQVEYDLGSENIIRDHGGIEHGKFEIGEQQYSYVVLPESMYNLNKTTADLLEEFMSNGGVVLSLGNPPVCINGVETERCAEWPNLFPEEWIAINGINDPRFINYLLSDEFILVEQEGGSLFHHRRIIDGGQLLFLVNSSMNEACKTRFVLQGNDMVKMNLFTGDLENYPCVLTSDILSFDANIPAAGSLLLYISNGEIKSRKSRNKKWRGRGETIEVVETTVSPVSENVINLDYCYLTSNEDTTDLIYYYKAQEKIFKSHGFSGNPWFASIQYKTSILDRDTFAVNSGFEVKYPFLIDTKSGDLQMKLVVERPELYKVSINGIPLNQIEGEWWLDKTFGVFDIESGVQAGENMILIKASPMSVHCELEPVYLIGDFQVFALDQAWIIGDRREIEIGSWKEQGYPFYSDKMEYTGKVKMDSRGMAKLVLPDWKGTLAYVEVNGVRAGQIFSSPGELRIEKFMKRGENSISVTVIGSMKNLLGPHHNVHRRGIVTPWSFRSAPEIQASGMEYDLLDYGLMEPFQLIVSD